MKYTINELRELFRNYWDVTFKQRTRKPVIHIGDKNGFGEEIDSTGVFGDFLLYLEEVSPKNRKDTEG